MTMETKRKGVEAMDCDKYLELMSAALDGELTAEDRRALDSHLAVCPECAALYQTLCGQSAALRELDCEVPTDLKQRIMENLPEQEKPAEHIKPVRWTPKTGRVIHWKRWAPVAAAACLALVVALVPKSGMMANKAQAPGMAAPMPSSAPAGQEPRAPGAAMDRDDSTMEVESYTHTDGSQAENPQAPPAADSQYGGVMPSTAPTPSEMPEPSEPTAPEAVEPEHYSFENPCTVRVHYGATPEPGAVVIGSVKSLECYLAQFDSLAFDGNGNSVPIEKLESLRESCTEEFFRTRRLLCVVVESGSGSNRYEIAPQGLSRDHVAIAAYIPEIGTCDMAAWLLTAEVDTMFEDGDVLKVVIERIYN